jgi:hypothetical protein
MRGGSSHGSSRLRWKAYRRRKQQYDDLLGRSMAGVMGRFIVARARRGLGKFDGRCSIHELRSRCVPLRRCRPLFPTKTPGNGPLVAGRASQDDGPA